MAAEVLAGLTIETVGWDHADAVRLRAEQQHEIDLRYAQPGRPSTTGPDGAPVPDPRDQVDPSNVFATLLLRVDGEPAGHAALRDLSGRDDYQGGLHPDGTSEVKRVYVAPGFRGRGLSRTLMNAAEDVARDAGVRHLILESGLMQPESLGLYLRLGYDPVESFGVFSDEPGSRCFGKWLVPADGSPQSAPAAGPGSAAGAAPALELHEVPWDDPGAAALRRAMWAFHQERYPSMVPDVEARGGYDVVDAERGRAALATFVATLDGRPVGCASVAAAPIGPEHLTSDPLRGVAGLTAASAEAADSRGFEMRNVFVDPAARRAGVATALVRQIEAEGRRRGGLALYLGTGIRQPEALRLYVKLGYRPVLPYPPHDPDNPVLLFLGKPL
ncbi:GNAT family N-acetyltransferase [Promicromonospora sp. MEB111]|uniref:GNAT family N-acetyltransferase n=1 Tax=Promicromonospora sp. MEB111 TaxID=3040301 RepID=UPI00254F84A4|nr:GNAT family N-acetyltransferase [Promicromonospora sp. MEB111]